ncbi:MAG TPA: carbonic anhydrase, partial [Polyangiales bacterium]
ERKNQEDPTFFAKLAEGQKPPFLWIGCADSRVPANEITGTQAGEVFVHRNIANLVLNTDMSLLSVLDYAVNVLEVKHVIVCGHYGCGGVLAAMGNRPVGLVDNWIGHIKDVYRMHRPELDAIADTEARGRRLVELNVLNAVHDLYANSIIQAAWRKRGGPHVHGWVYDIRNGLLQELESSFSRPQDLDPVYRMEPEAQPGR